MKICLSCHQTYNYLKNADEIKFDFKDRKAIPDFAEKYPEATMILQHNSTEEINWKEIEDYKILCKDNFIFCIGSAADGERAKERGIKFYLGYTIDTAYMLEAAEHLGVCYIKLGMPLFFEIEKLNKYNIPIRAIPNVCYMDGLPRENGINGMWIRPEDLDAYEGYIDTIEFEDCDVKKERALFRIYMQEKNWPGDMNMIFTNFNHPGVNRMIIPDVVEARKHCGQACATKSQSCRICYRAVDLANPDRIREYNKNIEEEI